MSERLDKIESILGKVAERQQETANQQAKQSEEIDTLLGAIATTEASIQKTDASVRRLTVKVEGNELIADTLRAEARADRLETRQLWNDAVSQMQTDRDAYRERFDAAMRRADERHAAQMEVIQTLLLELTKSNGNINSLRDRIDGLEAS